MNHSMGSGAERMAAKRLHWLRRLQEKCSTRLLQAYAAEHTIGLRPADHFKRVGLVSDIHDQCAEQNSPP